MFLVLESVEGQVEELWMDFTSTSRFPSIRNWTKGLTYKWARLLRFRGLHVTISKSMSRADALVEILLREEHQTMGPAESEQIKSAVLETDAVRVQPFRSSQKSNS